MDNTKLLIEILINLGKQFGRERSYVANQMDPTQVTQYTLFFELDNIPVGEGSDVDFVKRIYEVQITSIFGEEITIYEHRSSVEVHVVANDYFEDGKWQYSNKTAEDIDKLIPKLLSQGHLLVGGENEKNAKLLMWDRNLREYGTQGTPDYEPEI